MSNLSARLEFSGYSDYWSGASNRGRGGGCAFAYYDCMYHIAGSCRPVG